MQITINNITWEIIFTNDINDLTLNNGNSTLGLTDLSSKTIYLYYNLRGPLLRRVLMHEITHAFIFSYNYYLTLSEEEFICSFIDTYADNIIDDTNYILSNYFNTMVL